MQTYYIDTCIWIDYFEDRKNKFRPLGEWAFHCIKTIIANEDLIIVSDLLEEELKEFYSDTEITNIFEIVPEQLIIQINVTIEQLSEAKHNHKKINIPLKDCLHAIFARDHNAIFITRDKHFDILKEEITIIKPEELI